MTGITNERSTHIESDLAVDYHNGPHVALEEAQKNWAVGPGICPGNGCLLSDYRTLADLLQDARSYSCLGFEISTASRTMALGSLTPFIATALLPKPADNHSGQAKKCTVATAFKKKICVGASSYMK